MTTDKMTEAPRHGPEVCLKDATELFQKTRVLCGIEVPDTATSELSEHVQKIEKYKSVFDEFPFPENLEYKQKAGLVLVSSGTLAVLCDMAVKWFEITPETSSLEDYNNGISFLSRILQCLVIFTDHGAVVCKAVEDHQSFFPSLLDQLDAWREKHSAGTLTDKQNETLVNSLIILHNMASFEENVPFLSGLPNILQLLEHYAETGTKLTRCVAITTMAELVKEGDEDRLATNKEMVTYILQQLEEALQNENGYSSNHWQLGELIRAIAILAKNEDNKKLLPEGVLPYLRRVLLSCTESNDRTDCKRCHETIKALLTLCTLEQNQEAVMLDDTLLDCVVKIYRRQSKPHKDCFDTAEKVLFSLCERLQNHEKYKRIAFQILHGQAHETYDMKRRPRGQCLIINNKDFGQLETRYGTDVDRDKLTKLFEGMKFKVTCQNNATVEEMQQQLQLLADMNHEAYDLFVCCVLSHGGTGYVKGVNNASVELKNLMAPFQADNCCTLAGKPKLFFIQACQGTEGQRGHHTTETDVVLEDTHPVAIPNEADFLLGYGTVPGYVSYRHVDEGSWYISKLCEVLDIYYEHRDILDILTMVNKEVSKMANIDCNQEGVLQQVPAPMYTLRKKLIFGETKTE